MYLHTSYKHNTHTNTPRIRTKAKSKAVYSKAILSGGVITVFSVIIAITVITWLVIYGVERVIRCIQRPSGAHSIIIDL